MRDVLGQIAARDQKEIKKSKVANGPAMPRK